MEVAGEKEKACFIFPSLQTAKDAIAYSTSPGRGKDAVSPDQIGLRIFTAQIPLFVVFFPPPSMGVVHGFWVHAGSGISSRLAEETLKHLDTLKEVQVGDASIVKGADSPAHVTLRQRIAGLLERATADPPRDKKVSEHDVYLFQTGMSSIYWVHQYLLSKFNAPSVLFGFAFHSTIHILEDYGPGYEFLGLGTDEEIDKLEQHLSALSQQGKTLQAIWAEFPSNPLLVTPNLFRLRELADNYGTLLIIDDTIGSFCSVDVLGVADIVVSSLTKTFSGYADVMSASAVLNPSSKRYTELKELFNAKYSNNFFAGDAETLEQNSRTYLERSTVVNNNAEAVVNYLQSKAADPNSRVTKVFYPTVSSSLKNYTPFMRKPTADFKPGYGSLLSVEFDTLEATRTFYDNFHVHQGPHFGAHLTLTMGYTIGIYGTTLDWAAKYGLKIEQVRIGVGLEDTQELLKVVQTAVDAADALAKN